MEEDTWKDGLSNVENKYMHTPISYIAYFFGWLLSLAPWFYIVYYLMLQNEWSLKYYVSTLSFLAIFCNVAMHYVFRNREMSIRKMYTKMYIADSLNHFIPEYFEPNILKVITAWREKGEVSQDIDLLRSQILSFTKMYRLAGNSLKTVNEDLNYLLKEVEGKNFGDVKFFPKTLTVNVKGDLTADIFVGKALVEEEEME